MTAPNSGKNDITITIIYHLTAVSGGPTVLGKGPNFYLDSLDFYAENSIHLLITALSLKAFK